MGCHRDTAEDGTALMCIYTIGMKTLHHTILSNTNLLDLLDLTHKARHMQHILEQKKRLL